MAAVLDVEVKRFATACNLEPKFELWLIKESILGLEGVATLAAKEELLERVVLQLVATGIKELESIGKQIAFTKFWRKCRTAFDEASKSKSKPEVAHSVDQEIPEQDTATIIAAWEVRHNFMLTDTHLLTAFQQGKLWREHLMSPPQITFMDARQMRTRAMINMPTGTLVSIVPGQSVEGVEVTADTIERAFELWLKIRAYLMTLSYVSILKPDWSPYQAALYVSEQLLVFMTDTYRGHSPNVDFLIGAWGATSLFFSETTRVQKKIPAEIFCDVGKWQHK